MRSTQTGRAAWLARALAVMVAAGCYAVAGTAQADPDPAPGPKTVIDHDGTYAVGSDIVPGTYSSAGPVGDSACYWKRVGGDQILDNSMSKKPQVVQIEPTDTAFKTSRCQPWQKTDCPPTCAPVQQTPPGLPADVRSYLEHPPQAPPGASQVPPSPAPRAPSPPAQAPAPPPQVGAPPPQVPGLPPPALGPPAQVPGPPPQIFGAPPPALGPPPGPPPAVGPAGS